MLALGDTVDSSLAAWLQSQFKERHINAYHVAINSGLGVATISRILNDGHIPRIDTLTRLADYFETPREIVLRIAAGLSFKPLAGGPPTTPQDDDYLLDELREAFRQVPDEWKQEVIAQVELWARMTSPQGLHIIGADDETSQQFREQPKEILSSWPDPSPNEEPAA